MENEKELETTSNEAPSSEELEEAETNESEPETEEESVETAEPEEGLEAQDEKIDHDAELKKEQERLGGKLDKERDKRMGERKKFIPREEAEKLIDEKVGEVEKRLLQDRATVIAERLAGSPAERDLILLHYNNSIISSGNVEEDMNKAFVLANSKRFQGTISELKKSAKSKDTRLSGSGAGTPPKKEVSQEFSQEDIDGAKFAGVTPEEFVKKKNE